MRQIGHNLRLSGCLLSDDNLDPSLVVASTNNDMKKTLEIRAAAQEAYIKSQTEVALSKAKNGGAECKLILGWRDGLCQCLSRAECEEMQARDDS